MSTAEDRERALPRWTEDLRRRYLRGEASQFILHGNVNDLMLSGGKFIRFGDFLSEVLLAPSKDVVIKYDLATGVRFAKKKGDVPDLDLLLSLRDADKILPLLEKLLHAVDRVAVILDYAEMIAPAGDPNFFSSTDRQSVVTLHRWSFSPALERADSVVLIVTENLSELSPKLVANPTTAILKIPMPELGERREAIRATLPKLEPAWIDRVAELTAGLKVVQIKGLLAGESSDDATQPTLEKLLPLVRERKREIIQRECFDLIEFVEPKHDFSVVGGLDEVKKELLVIAENLREQRISRCPMGVLFTGPMGTGKTFVAEAFVKETGLTAIKLKNFRSKWVGATEGNLEKILSVVQALGPLVVIVDEGDRAFGNQDGEGDGGTSSRVMARLKEFMSDTSNRGRVLFLIMTNRPDKLDIDIKRAGRLDRKIPFLYPQEPSEVEAVLAAQIRKHHVVTSVEFPRDTEALSAKLVGYSNADIEAVVMLACDYARDATVTLSHFVDATRDYLPSRDSEMLEYMELVAVFEASNRRMLPKKYADLPVEELEHKLAELRARVGARR
ncbi:MAG TPA: ATP-binding protein [Polyangiaceae bacterium]|nr:ATP-binding protein [Polyangiaceae bacterium]